MATAFTDQEKAQIVAQLREAAWRHAGAEGMRKTSVEMLAAETGISKGAFYHFYASKELLFLDMLESWQKNVYAIAEKVLNDNADLPAPERASLAFRAAFRAILNRPVSKFVAQELPLLLRRIPPEVLREHYQTQEEFVIRIIRQVGVTLTVPDHTAAAAVYILLLSLVHAERVGPYYDQGIEALVDSACRQMIAE